MTMTTTCDPFAAAMLRFCDREGLLPRGSRVLIALSGGRDSMALLTALQEAAADRDLTLLAAHYDHGLRGEESRRDRDFVTAWCAEQGIPLTVGAGDVAGQAARTRRGIEETARAMRYAFLEETARSAGADVIATAHNADDNLETVLLHLTRGTGLDGLTGIPPRRGKLIRPLLAAPRSDIDGYLARTGVPWVEDSSNAETAYARNRIRREVLPVLKTINPGLAATLAADLVHLRGDRDWLYAQAAPTAALAEGGPGTRSLPAAALTRLPRPVAIRAVKLLLGELDRYQISAVHLDQILALAESRDPSSSLSLPQGLTARRDYDRLILTLREEAPASFSPVPVPGPGTYPLENGWTAVLTLGIGDGTQGAYRCHLAPPAFPLTLRPRAPGDRLALPGRRSKTLKKWHIDEKIPRRRRDALPVLADSTTLLAAAGLGPQAHCIAPAGAPALTVEFLPPPGEYTT